MPYSSKNEPEELAPDPARQEKARKYASARRRATLAELASAGIFLLVLVFSGLSVIFRELLISPSVPAAAIYFVGLMVVYGILSAPLSYYSSFVLPHRYGLSIQTFGGWLGDTAKAWILGLIAGTGIVAAAYWFLSSFPATWWLLTWGVVVALISILTSLAPIIIFPIFVKMKPLDDDELRLELEQLAQQANTSVRGIYTMELGSKATSAYAALMGVGSTKRIALSDTLLQRYSSPEIEAVMAHELGHNSHNDIFRMFIIESAILLVGFYIIDLVFTTVVAPLGFDGISDVAALPLLILISSTLSLVAAPLTNAYSRHLEAGADDYALRLTKNPGAFINLIIKLTDQNLSEAEPSRWVELLTYDHPCYSKRIKHARHYSTKEK